MFLQVLKLLIRTRFTPYYFLGLFFILLYSFFAQAPQEAGVQHLAGILYVSFVLCLFGAISILLGGLMSTKSDSEFLFVSAVERRDLAPALFISQFLTTGPLILAGSLYYVITNGSSGLIEVIAIVDLLFLALLTVSLGITLSVLKTYQRAVLAAVFVLWIFSSLLGFGLGGTSFLHSNPWPSTFLITAVTLLSVAGAVIALSGDHLPIRISALKSGSRDFRKISRFLNLSPFRTVLRFGITQVSIASRSASLGSVRVSARRIRLMYFVIAMIAASVFYVIVTLEFPLAFDGGEFNITVFMFSFYLGIFPQVMISSGAIATERAWLSFMSMEPWRYMRFLIISKMAQTFILSIPMTVASLILWVLGIPLGLEAAICFVSLPPTIVSLYLFFSFSSKPYQMRDEEYLATRFGGTQYLIVIPVFLYSFAVIAILVVPISTPIVLGVLYLSTFYLLTRRQYWNKKLNKAVESGFV